MRPLNSQEHYKCRRGLLRTHGPDGRGGAGSESTDVFQPGTYNYVLLPSRAVTTITKQSYRPEVQSRTITHTTSTFGEKPTMRGKAQNRIACASQVTPLG